VEVSVSGLIDTMKKHWDQIGWETGEDQEGIAKKEAGLLKLCIDKALRQLEWKPVLNFEETIDITTNWYKAFYMDKKVNTDSDISQYEKAASERGIVWARS
jgi:CDP-glucose 4,6-dehydratase